MRLGHLLVTATALAAGSLVASPTTATSYAAPAPRERPAVIEKVVIGHSVKGRPIVAWHLGEPRGKRVLLVATMHGDEGRPRQILNALRDGRRIHDLNLWVVPVYNPDGLARGTRKNARGVDLNRNFPYHWADLDGSYESGSRAGSEPETRAMMRFLRKLRPTRILSFHQPLHGVDTDTKRPSYSRHVARELGLPLKSFTCGGVCHGTMTGWFNRRFDGAAVTVEYGARPSRTQMRTRAPRQVLRIFGGTRITPR
ncbi:M14 family zinc carboxypeptidase [Nocardioides sp. URHA0020]|uniref:M14 family zinc carboxypeptidase n=1 Tax=Nocardioides sp. URHA0020 TaxID=1380392 RepID=UPI0006871A53|nr:M14 family zinc carboxypeptidase [Nocardioides sp. URHA0020]